MENVTSSLGWLQANLINILFVIVIAVIAYWIAGVVKSVILRIGKSQPSLDETLFHFLGSIARYGVMIFAGIIILDRFGIQTTSLVAILGAASLAVGLALQGTLSSLAAGVMLILFRPYKVGDFVEAAGTFGKVEAVTLFTTDMITFDNQQIIIPNSEIWGTKITNHSHHAVRGVDMIASVGYGTDIKKAKASIAKVLKANKQVLSDPAPFVEVETLGASSVDLLVRPFVTGADYFDVKYALPQAIYEQFAKDRIEIPFQQVVVHNAN
ncbi:mechanosensitive ion channel domain-containing protein [Aliiroseovarius subalbicans]|uniref:mechanosensitive ion channel family protein n=1 Tax=Aliiroseovarius subalbicans TaxID=2925840 RepID=UPI001F593A75|nr:mechanosensitive ion channel domain-containing protein [Aliiroseovarius subalbicans]MCI2397766.1 mechanosensitive ion channel [Aliiroseovarius subalbicans]